MEPAPFYRDIADAAPDARALWVEAPDGARVRLGLLGAGGRGTVLLFPGRTEFVEKYGPAGRAFAERGYGTLGVDWRGQGLTDRFLPDRRTGHIERFDDYQHDVAAMMQAAHDLDLPRPWHLLGHSMGGAIGLRALYAGLPVASAVFTGPMWGIRIAALLRPVAWLSTSLARPLGYGGQTVLTGSPENYLLSSPFEGNMLTSDRGQFDRMKAQLVAYPELALGGPSNAWVNEALREVRRLRTMPPPELPALCIAGALEGIVELSAMRRRMADWPGGRFLSIPGAQHEVMMETAPVRRQVFDAAVELFSSVSHGTV